MTLTSFHFTCAGSERLFLGPKNIGYFNVSSLTVFEILKGLRKKSLKGKEKVFQKEILKHKVFALDYAIMDSAATLLTALEEKGTPIAHGDLFIAAYYCPEALSEKAEALSLPIHGLQSVL